MSQESYAAFERAAHHAGLTILESADARGFNDVPTHRYRIARKDEPQRSLTIELSKDFDSSGASYETLLAKFLGEFAHRLRNLHPEQNVTLAGLPVAFTEFAWPFHTSTSGADTFVVHGVVRLADGTQNPLHAKVAAGMTLTFAEIVPAPEQPFAEMFVYNAIRKTFDQGQLELTKAGNRQPVPVTTRYYSRWTKKYNFSDTTAEQRQRFLARKLYWLSAVNGGYAPVWLADPADAQYMNCSPEDLLVAAIALEKSELGRGWDHGMWSATPKLAAQGESFHKEMQAALDSIKPSFNEEMRAGHTNM